MLEDSLDPRPNFQAVLAAVLASGRREPMSLASDLARLWDERQGDWANLRDISHWLERAR